MANQGVGQLRHDPVIGSVVKWMEDQGIVQGDHISPSLLTLKTCFSKPCQCSGFDSRLDIRFTLESTGWSRCETAWDASVQERRFNAAGTLEYFKLLKHHTLHLEEYEKLFGFKHSQSKGYYEAFLSMFTHKLEDLRRNVGFIAQSVWSN